MRTRTARQELAPEKSVDVDACREAALRLLERSRRTRADLARRLCDKGYVAAAIEPVLARLTELGLVDDAEYARAYLAGRWGRRPAGWIRLQGELRSRGVGADDIARARELIEAREGAPDELAAARKVVAQASRRVAALEPRLRRQRLYALLARRGFDGDVIRRALAIRDDER